MKLADQLRSSATHCHPTCPLTHRLLVEAADDLTAGGITAQVLAGAEHDPPGSVPGLRLAAALHRLVLTRRAPRLALHYPTVGGQPRLESLWSDARQALQDHTELAAWWVRATAVQTNEVGRSAPLWGGLQVAAQHADGLGVRLLEVGASAGLNLRPDRIAYTVDGRMLGAPDSVLQLDPQWSGRPPADLRAQLRVRARAGCDLHPVDSVTTDGRAHLCSFVWPSDAVRWDRLRSALDLAAAEPVTVRRESGPDFLAVELAGCHPGQLTVVWHSVVWQYVNLADRERGRAVLAEAAARATVDAPLALLVYESVRAGTGFRFELRLRLWPHAPQQVLLGHGGGHGIPFTWA